MMAYILLMGSLAFLLILFGFCIGYYMRGMEKTNMKEDDRVEEERAEIETFDSVEMLDNRIAQLENLSMMGILGGVYTR